MSHGLKPFAPEDLAQAAQLLAEAHRRAASEMPSPWPGHDAAAALWAAQWFYRATQLLQLRDQPEAALAEHLPGYSGRITPEAMASVDLTLRHLPNLKRLASHLAPGDKLVQMMAEVAVQWPLSSVGLKLEAEPHLTTLQVHSGLLAAYRDRIIAAQDSTRLSSPAVVQLVAVALGDHAKAFWPEFHLFTLPSK